MSIENPASTGVIDPELIDLPSGPAIDVVPVTPSDSVDLAYTPKGVYIETGGNLAFLTVTNASRVLPLDRGWHPISPKRILVTGTTAVGIHIAI